MPGVTSTETANCRAMKRPPPPSFAMASTAIEESTVPMGSMAGMASAVPRAAPVVPLPLAEPGRAPSSSLPESQPCSFPAGDEEA